MKLGHISSLATIALPLVLLMSTPIMAQTEETLTPSEARSIAKEAYTYANPVVDSYRILYSYFVDSTDPDYKAPWNHIKNISRVFTHEDRAVQTPNSDTPYSWLALDLRTEPMVLTVPPIDEGRYFSIEFFDLYSHAVDYIGTRTTGNDGGHFLLTGPGWEGNIPDGITKTYEFETELMLAVFRTQLFNTEDLEKVLDIQGAYHIQPLSSFLGKAAPEAAPEINFIAPLSKEEIKESPKVFEHLNFVLQFCPPHPSEKELMKRFAKLNIGAGKTFDWDAFSPEIQEAIKLGISDAWDDFSSVMKKVEAGEVGSGDAFGSREFLKNNYLYRMAAAVLGIWGNIEAEAIYPTYYVDADGKKLNGSNRYTLRFEPGQLPPVNSFWSLTMYELPESLLTENPLDRYLVNSPMLDTFVRDADGGITFYLQHESPGKDKEPNWLPAPKGPFSATLRLYWPKEEALDGTWKLPPLQRVK
jgi:hypothetical protein